MGILRKLTEQTEWSDGGNTWVTGHGFDGGGHDARTERAGGDAARRSRASQPSAHVAALVAHPEAVRSALAAADALTAGDGERRSEVETIAGHVLTTVDATEADRRLSARARDGAPERLLISEEVAARTGLRTRQTVHDGRRKGRIVGWQNARRGYVLPAEQLDGRNRPREGLDRVAGRFADGYAAWIWLTTPRPSLDGAPPLALLARGEVERLAEARGETGRATLRDPRVRSGAAARGGCVRSVSSLGPLMRQVVTRLYTLQANADDLDS